MSARGTILALSYGEFGYSLQHLQTIHTNMSDLNMTCAVDHQLNFLVACCYK